MKKINGFSKFSKEEKLEWLSAQLLDQDRKGLWKLKEFWHSDDDKQKVFDDFSENTISNFIMPYSIAPNFLINGQDYAIPMVIEESSVVAAASNAAKFWYSRGGFHTEVLDCKKLGQVHFEWYGKDFSKLENLFNSLLSDLKIHLKPITRNMDSRGGGVLGFKILNKSQEIPNYYQVLVEFNTCDAMGANFINSVLEEVASYLKYKISEYSGFTEEEKNCQIIMAILSNYTPDCRVKVAVDCPISSLGNVNGLEAKEFAHKFKRAVDIARVDEYRAVTHNKGIYNGIDAVVLATGNDFRAIEACAHAYASHSGKYRSLSHCSLDNGTFHFELEVPMALGTVGGLTSLHPLAKTTFEILGKPDAKELMQIAVSVGLASNFAAIRSLVTTGIQKGHMKMHLLNICRQFEASDIEVEECKLFFEDKIVSFTGVRDFIKTLRSYQ